MTAMNIEATRLTGGVKVEMCEKLGLVRNGLDGKLKPNDLDLRAMTPSSEEEEWP